MSDVAILIIVAFGFAWGFGMARAMDFLDRLEADKANREAIKAQYLRQRHVRLPSKDGGPDA
jgi:hypothetical protein